MNKGHLIAVGIGVLIGVALAPKIKQLPVLSKIPQA